MKFYKLVFVCVFLFSCSPKDIQDEDNGRVRSAARVTDRGSDRGDYRSSELRRLKNSSNPVIRSFLESRYSNPSHGYRGDDCEEISACLDICENRFSSRLGRKCEKAPAEFIENLEEDLFKLINISDLDEVDISPAFISSILDFDEDLLSDLIKDNMSEGDLKTFLAWIAVNEKVSEAFESDRRSKDILKEAFEKLGEFNKGGRELETAFNIGLITEDDTFLSLASDEANEEGFSLAYEVLDDSCFNRDCKLYVLCSREKQTNSRSRIFGVSRRNSSSCKTSTRTDGRARPGETCYIQGSNVWSFLEELIYERDIKDSDFDEEEEVVTVRECNEFCGSVRESNTKCSRIL